MSVTGTLSADGTVQVHCPRPGCSATLRVKPRSGRTWVTCAAAGCGHKFVLEVPGLAADPAGPPPSGAQPAPPPVPPRVKETFDLRKDDLDKPHATSSKPARPRPTDRPKRDHRRDEPAEKSGNAVALVAGGVLAALVVGGGLIFGLVYFLRDKDSGPPAAGPVAQAQTTTTAPITIPVFSPPPVPPEPVRPKADLVPGAPVGGPPPVRPVAPPPKTGAGGEADDPEEVALQSKKKPKKGGEPKADPTPAGDALERVKKSTALIERPDGGSGTGFVIKSGLVMTNHHVIAGAPLDGLKVSFVSLDETAPDKLKQTLLYCHPERDIAILRVDIDRPPLDMCPSGTRLEGLEVAVVGNPTDGVRGQVTINKVTTGRLAAPIRRNALWTYYELNAEARPGNSGGPVVDRHSGKLVGVMQSIAVGKGAERSYCIPFGEATKALERLPATRDKEPEATRIAVARHALDFFEEKMPGMERMGRLGMDLRRAILQAKADGPGARVIVRTENGAQLSGDEVMTQLKEEFDKTRATLDRLLSGPVRSSPEVPSGLRSKAQAWLEACTAMRGMAGASHSTETAFNKDATERATRNERAARAFDEDYKKFVAGLDATPPKSK